MAPNRKPRRSKRNTILGTVSETCTHADDPELEAILKLTENKMVDLSDGTESNRLPESEGKQASTPVSVYVGCLVPSPTVDVLPVPPTPLCWRAPEEIELYCRSRERFMKRLHKIKRQTQAAAEAITKTRATRDIKRIYRAMKRAKAKVETICIKRLFERESDSE